MASTPTPRPERGPKGYAFPSEGDQLRDWDEVEARIRDGRFYWLATTLPTGAAHVRPLWGVWVERALYFDGHPLSRWARNIARDGRASFHLEDATNVVIVEGHAEDLQRTDQALGERIAAAWAAKYGKLVPDAAANGIFRLLPTKARAWSEDLTDATVWAFAERP
ncbi:MAG: pyridoxamine 5'-phosphate oxidase family protein [Gaiellaceae bacterium]